MFRRDSEDDRYAIAGLWGSGNTVAPRGELYGGGDYTAYTMWDGHALFGPGRPGALEKAAVLSAVLPVEEFLARYASLGEACEVWPGEEALGLGCDALCPALAEACPDDTSWVCEEDCALLPPTLVECLSARDTCPDEAACGLEEWLVKAKAKPTGGK